MKTFVAEFVKTKCSFDADFGQIQTAGAGDYEKGYEIGYEEGHQKGYENGETNGYSNGFVDGQKSVPNPLEYCLSGASMFADVIFPTEYELILNIPLATNLDRCFYKTSGIKKITLKGNNNENVIYFPFAFRQSSNLETIDLTEYKVKISNASYMFAQSKKLKEILGVLDFSECTNVNYTFYDCPELVTVTPKENSIKLSISFAQSSNLSATSIQSIIDGLAYVDTAQTITFHKNTVLTDEQRATISSKGWTLVQ